MCRILQTAAATAMALLAAMMVGAAPAAAQPAPTANAGGPYTGVPGRAITLTAADTGPGATYRWTFGDGTTDVGRTVTKSYLSPGTYAVSVTVSAATGARATGQSTGVVAAQEFVGTGAHGCVVSGAGLVCSGPITQPGGTIMLARECVTRPEGRVCAPRHSSSYIEGLTVPGATSAVLPLVPVTPTRCLPTTNRLLSSCVPVY